MSDIQIVKITDKKGLKQFIDFTSHLYRSCPYVAPELREDMLYVLDPEQNAAFQFCDCDRFLAIRDGKVVGRVAAIVNKKANNKWGTKVVRFGWIDFIDDINVCRALLEKVEEFGRERGMEEMEGPLGFTDFDPEGCLVDGFEELDTIGTLYNYDYYPRFYEELGLTKAVDWVEQAIEIPNEVPAKHHRVAQMIAQRYHLRVRSLKNKKEGQVIGPKLFDIINEAYAKLFGYSEMSGPQVDHYIKEYLPAIDPRMVAFVEKEDTGEVIGMAISAPSMTKAMQRAKGRMFPFGWWHLLGGLKWKRSNIVDLMLIAVLPEYQNLGINALLFDHLIPIYNKMGFTHSVVYPQLETNSKGVGLWDYFSPRTNRRRRCYKKGLI